MSSNSAAVTASERRAASDERKRARGQTRVSVWLPTKLVESLDAIAARPGHGDRASLIAGMLTYVDSQLTTGELQLQPG